MGKDHGHNLMTDVGLLGMRLVVGGLIAGHGAQKLFGMFGGNGLKGTAGWMESIGMKPGDRWAALAGASEFGGGLLTATGLLSPIGPITIIAPMTMATRTVHANKPVWAAAGGPELPVINIAIASGLMFAGPGRFSLDSILRIKLPFFLAVLAAMSTAAGVYIGLSSREHQPAPSGEQTEAAPKAASSQPEPENAHAAPATGSGGERKERSKATSAE